MAMAMKDGTDEEENVERGMQHQQQQQSQSQRLRSFCEQKYGLTLSASRLAACVGLNPYANVPELLLRLVYQGREGYLLQRSDALLLGIELVSDEEQLRTIATKGGAATRSAVESALLVQNQKKSLKTTDEVRRVHQQALQEAQKSGKLSPQELAVLNEGVRSAVFKGFGISHEAAALDWYEMNYCGCPVTERNSETKYWAFAKDDTNPQAPRVVPLQLQEQKRVGVESQVCQVEADQAPTEIPAHFKHPFFVIAGKIDGVRDEMAPTALVVSGVDASGDENEFDGDGDGWMMRRVLVECKHRIRALRQSIPVYEVVQATAYCYMFDAQVADLVQVLRKVKSAAHKRSKSSDATGPVNAQESTSDIRNYFARARSKELQHSEKLVGSLNAEGATASSNQPVDRLSSERSNGQGDGLDVEVPPNRLPEQEITVSVPQLSTDQCETTRRDTPVSESDLFMNVIRLDLDDPVLQPRHLWHSLVLPRLRSFVDAVYAIRSDDSKRYRLLQAVAIANGDVTMLESAWSMLHQECPWLVDCDTAFYRSRWAS